MGAQRGVVRALRRTSLQANPCTEESEASEMVQQQQRRTRDGRQPDMVQQQQRRTRDGATREQEYAQRQQRRARDGATREQEYAQRDAKRAQERAERRRVARDAPAEDLLRWLYEINGAEFTLNSSRLRTLAPGSEEYVRAKGAI